MGATPGSSRPVGRRATATPRAGRRRTATERGHRRACAGPTSSRRSSSAEERRRAALRPTHRRARSSCSCSSRHPAASQGVPRGRRRRRQPAAPGRDHRTRRSTRRVLRRRSSSSLTWRVLGRRREMLIAGALYILGALLEAASGAPAYRAGSGLALLGGAVAVRDRLRVRDARRAAVAEMSPPRPARHARLAQGGDDRLRHARRLRRGLAVPIPHIGGWRYTYGAQR